MGAQWEKMIKKTTKTIVKQVRMLWWEYDGNDWMKVVEYVKERGMDGMI